MDTILNDLAKQYQEQFKNQNYYRRGGPMMMEDMAVGQAAMQNAPMKSEASRDQSQ